MTKSTGGSPRFTTSGRPRHETGGYTYHSDPNTVWAETRGPLGPIRGTLLLFAMAIVAGLIVAAVR